MIERPSENYFSVSFEITGDVRISLGYDSSCVCYRLDYGMVWNHSVTTKTACVRTAHTLHLNLKVCVARSGRVCGVATHAVGGMQCRLRLAVSHRPPERQRQLDCDYRA